MLVAIGAALLAQASPPQAAMRPEEDIVVVGERIKQIRVVTRRDRKTGERRCIVRRSSRDRLLDGAFCEATLACARTETRQEGMTACMETRMSAIAERFTRRSEPRNR